MRILIAGAGTIGFNLAAALSSEVKMWWSLTKKNTVSPASNAALIAKRCRAMRLARYFWKRLASGAPTGDCPDP